MNTIPNLSLIDYVSYKSLFSAICSIGERPFWGTIHFEYRPTNRLLEFISVEEWVATLARQELTIEDVARLSFDEAQRALRDVPLRVSVQAETTVHGPTEVSIGMI